MSAKLLFYREDCRVSAADKAEGRSLRYRLRHKALRVGRKD